MFIEVQFQLTFCTDKFLTTYLRILENAIFSLSRKLIPTNSNETTVIK